MGHPPAVPSSMKEPRNIAKFVDFIDRDIFAKYLSSESFMFYNL